MINTQELVSKTSNLFRFGRFEEANKIIDQALKDDPNCFEARLEKIRAALFQDKTDDAFRFIDEAATLYANDPRLVALQGIWFLENQQFEGAKATLTWAAQALPDDSNIRLNLAIALRNLGDFKEAEKQVLKSLLFNPASELAHFEYSKILMLQGKPQEAVLQILKALECNIYFIPGFLALNNYFKMKKDPDAAILLYKDAIRIAPDADFFYGQLALLYEEKGEYAQALPYAEHLAQKNQSYYDDLRVGIYTFLSGNTKKAEAIFLKCIERDPKKWDAYYNLGEIYLTQNKTNEAQDYYQKALERVNALDSRPANQLGIIALSQNDFAKAEEYFKDALAINPNSFDATFNMALTFKKNNNKTQAGEWGKKAFNLAGENITKKYTVQKFLTGI